MQSIIIRKATLQDIPEIVILVNLSYRSQEFRGWTTEADIIAGERIQHDQVKKIIMDNCSNLFLAYTEHHLIGCVHLQIEDTYGYIGLLTTHPKIQNQGLGKKLLHYAECYALEHDQIRVFKLSVLSTRAELIAFYERRNYIFTGHIEDYPLNAQVGIPLNVKIQVFHFKKIV